MASRTVTFWASRSTPSIAEKVVLRAQIAGGAGSEVDTGGGPAKWIAEPIGTAISERMLPLNKRRIGPPLPPLATMVRQVVPDAGVPLRPVRTGPDVDYSAELQAEPGSGVATGKFLGVLDKEPVLAERLNQDEQIPKDFLAMADRDHEFAAAHGLQMRADVQRMRRIIGEGPGWVERLRAAHAVAGPRPPGATSDSNNPNLNPARRLSTASAPGSIQNGCRFRGGNPANPNK